ncbi:nuclear transport factor 2 family protein [Cohnella lupini]|uniref:SnoaL-like protein n=1 Tax=Cohnella lupini TaxID=1294267 RepID=A0A3D9IK02_9BACL|nr:nuclear transport factor 2 family protein [Cohnella lupini]RED61849.1 SnoaL-like protein [Cohnella lupini]
MTNQQMTEQENLINRINELEKRYQRLDDIEEIKKLKARYFRFVDEKNWSGLAKLFTADVKLNPGHEFKNGEEMSAVIESLVGAAPTVHHGHMPEIDWIDENHATGIWAMEDLLTFPDKEGAPEGHNGYGQYRESYERVDGDWKISVLDLTRFRMDPLANWDPSK